MGRIGSRFIGVTGALLYGLGIFLSSFAGSSLSLLYLTYGVVAALGLGLAVVSPMAVLPLWFLERPGFAYGVAFVGFGMGPLVNVPLMQALLSRTGEPLETFYFLGIIYAALISGAAWLVRYPPGRTGIALAASGSDDAGEAVAWGASATPSRHGSCTPSGTFSSSTPPRASPSSRRPG